LPAASAAATNSGRKSVHRETDFSVNFLNIFPPVCCDSHQV
jgi:hypothetical protein